MSGGTENTKYYVSGLVKNDEGIALNTGYKKQALRSNLDQELGSGLQLQVNLDGTHSLSKRGLSNNDNSGTSPYLVFPGTPNFFDLLPAGGIRDDLIPIDFPTNVFERSNPLQTFSFLKNEEDVWRLLGTTTLRWSALRSARTICSSSASAAWTISSRTTTWSRLPSCSSSPVMVCQARWCLSKSSNRNLNAALNMVYRLNPSGTEGGAEWTTSAGVQFEERKPFVTQIVGRTLLPGQESPQQTVGQSVTSKLEPVRDLGLFAQEEVLLANRNCCLPPAFAPIGAANGNTGKYFFYPKLAASYRLPARSAGWTTSSFAAPTGRPATGRHASVPRTSPTPRGPSAAVRHLHQWRGGGPNHRARASAGVRGRLRRHARQWQGGADAHGISAGHSQSYPGTDHRSFHGPGVPHLHLGQPAA